MGDSWATLWRSGARLARFLGVTWGLLGASWKPNAAQEGFGPDFKGFWEGPGKAWEVPRLYFSMFFHTFRHIMVLIMQSPRSYISQRFFFFLSGRILYPMPCCYPARLAPRILSPLPLLCPIELLPCQRTSKHPNSFASSAPLSVLGHICERSAKQSDANSFRRLLAPHIDICERSEKQSDAKRFKQFLTHCLYICEKSFRTIPS